jgi:hypothetical protein
VAFQQSLEKLGGRNLQVDYRWKVVDNAGTARIASAELLRLSPDVILADNGSALEAAQQATHTIPICAKASPAAW